MMNAKIKEVVERLQLDLKKMWNLCTITSVSVEDLQLVIDALETTSAKIARFEEYKRDALAEAAEEREAWIKILEADMEYLEKENAKMRDERENK